MKRNILAAILLVAAVAFSCTSKEEASKSLINDGSIVYNPTVSIADFVIDGPATKTTLSIDQTTGAKFTFVDGDELGVYPYDPEQGDQVRFTFTSTGADASAFTFNGSGFGLKANQLYAAYYPADLANAGAECMTEIPVDYTKQRQTSLDGTSFDISAADYLVSNGISPENNACDFTMSHVGALLVMDVTVAEAGNYTELKLASAGTPFVTKGALDLTAAAIAIDPDAAGDATLALGPEGGNGLAITANQTVRFCMMVAPVDLRSTTVTISLKDSEGVEHTGNFKNGNFKAGKAYLLTASVSASETPEPAEPTNLSQYETANCYVVNTNDLNAAGYYFNATVAGNGNTSSSAIFPNLGYNNPYPAPGGTATLAEGHYVRVPLNQNNCISDVTISDGKISFKATGAKGNAKIQMRDASDNGVWVWTIWCTDKPGKITIPTADGSKSYTIMDRNLGAITNQPGDTEAEYGLYYMFGDPIGYTVDEWNNAQNGNAMVDELAHSPSSPCCNAGGTYAWFNQYAAGNYSNQVHMFVWGGMGENNIWGAPAFDPQPGTTAVKTLYDPCPVGYKVMAYDVLDGYDHSNNHSNMTADTHGMYLSGSDGTAFFPYNGLVHSGGYVYNWATHGPYYTPLPDGVQMAVTLWTSRHVQGNMARPYWILSRGENAVGGGGMGGDNGTGSIIGRGMGVRCMK